MTAVGFCISGPASGILNATPRRHADELHRPAHPHDLPHHRRLPAHGLCAAAWRSPSRRSGPGSIAAAPTGSTITSAISPSSSRSAPPSSASSTTPGCASTPRKPRTSRCRARSSRMIPEFLDKPERAGHRRDRPQQEHRQRGDHLPGTPRPGRQDRRAHPDPHAAPGGQVQGHADDRGHAQERSPRQAAPRLHRSRRGTHGPAGARQRLLVRHDALPDDEVHAGPGRATSSRWSAPSASWPTRPATGASPTRWRCPN